MEECNILDILESLVSIFGLLLTIIVIIYNHKAIKLTQESIKQATSLQLYEKRLELYNSLSSKNAFDVDNIPNAIKIVFSDELYEMYKQIAELCQERLDKIHEFVLIFNINYQIPSYFNISEEEFCFFENEINKKIEIMQNEDKIASLQNHRDTVKNIHDEICYKQKQLEQKMKNIINDSIQYKEV